VEDLDREVLTLLAEHDPLLLLQDLARAVMGIDDAVAQLELDVLELDLGRLEVLNQLIVGVLGNGDPPWLAGVPRPALLKSAGSDPRG
jgi:hypothetical protein